MALKREVIRALESVLGTKNVSEEPTVLFSYSYMWEQALINKKARLTDFQPEAVVLPSNTQEVSDILKIFARYKVKSKALSVGWGPWALAGQEGVVLIDLKRMNRIIDIDAKNRYAIVEPYVSAGVLETELEQRGFTVLMIGAGAMSSTLASTTAGWGFGPKGPYCGHNSRNALGIEWVLPTGEIVRLGSAGAGAGWFCGDGPGPSLRGVYRGWRGSLGGLGVFTKAAVKVYPTHAPAKKRETVGEHPQVGLKIPENHAYHMPCWDNFDSLADAMYKINDCEIGLSVWRQGPVVLGTNLTTNNNEFFKALPKLIENRFHIEVLLAAESMRELEYQEKVLKDIVTETKGRFIDFDEEPYKGQIPALYMYHMKGVYGPRIFRPTGDFGTSYGAPVDWDTSIRSAKLGEKLIKKYTKPGLFLDVPEDFWGGFYERRFTHFEGVCSFDPNVEDSVTAAFDYVREALDDVIKHSLGIPIVLTPEGDELLGPLYSNYPRWVRKFKKALDSENLSDHSFYQPPGD
jgi:glycolate oxidase